MKHKKLSRSIWLSSIFVSLLWVIQSAGVLFSLPLNLLGVKPMEWSGIYGIVTAPLVHGSYEHLFSNTLPLIILGSALHYGYPKSRQFVLVCVWLICGLGVFFFARPATHLGASGISHGLFFFLFTVSILRRDKRSVGLMMIAFFMYGGMIMSIFPRDPVISFESHFFGALGGVISALIKWKADPKPTIRPYEWELHDTEDPVIGTQWKQHNED